MRNVYFYGALAKQFGNCLRLRGNDVGAILRLLEVNFPGKFYKSIKDGYYRVVAGKSPWDERGVDIVKGTAGLLLGDRDLHIMPVAEGGGGFNPLKIILGIVLIAFAFYAVPMVAGTAAWGSTAFAVGSFGVSWTNIALFGASLILQGVAGLLTPMPKVGGYNNREAADERQSAIFNGAVNSIEQGNAVPVVYGRYIVGSVVMSGQVIAEQI